jgi:aldehyde:ferredoxin oxidoreductase
MFGWVGTTLRVNLTDRTARAVPLDPALARQFIGARGLATKIMHDEVDPTVDALAPENKLIFAPGPFSGTLAPSAGRYNVVTKGPLTGTIAASNSGGMLGAELKFAGYDLVVLEGKADRPVYVFIRDGAVEVRDAGHLWGKEVPDATDLLRAETDDDAKVACIGPGGEKRALIANVLNEMHRAAGRSGVGAVMGSKNLKALVVLGGGAVTAMDPAGFKTAMVRARNKILAHPVGGQGLKAFGTDVLINILNQTGGLPTRNFRDGHFPTADKVGGETLSATLLKRPKACFGCVISCGRVTEVVNPKYQGKGEGPEYETAWALGPDCGVDDLEAITKANYRCNELGLDPISMGSTIACAMDLYEHGILTLQDTDGIPLTFGNAEGMVAMVEKTGRREGLGDRLALGSYRLAESVGHPEYSMTVKKQEMPAYDPRAVQGIGLNYATSNRGGCHVRGYTIASEVLGLPAKTDNMTTEGKAALTIAFQNLTAALDATGACLFGVFGMEADDLAQMLTALTGVAYPTEEFLRAGERIWNLERLFNLKAGLTTKDDTLPERLLKEPMPTGAAKGQVNRLGEMLPEYYQLRGWDKNGVPTDKKLKELALV